MAVFDLATAPTGSLPQKAGLGSPTDLSTATATVLAQLDPEVDVLLQMREGFNNFIESGQVWALAIGFFLGYLFRSITG